MRSGERCEKCHIGRMRTRSVFTRGMSRIRYLVCKDCHHTGKEVMPIDDLGRAIIVPIATHSNLSDSQATPTR